jgi:TPR repeat protein
MKFTIPILALAALFAASGARADLDLIRHAAEAGNAEAQLELGILFQYGFNYKDNEVPALTWYTLSANQGNAKAGKLRDALKAKMTDKDIQEVMEQVSSYKPKPAAGGVPYSTLPSPDTRAAPAAATPPTETSPAPESAPTEAPVLPAPAAQ